MFSIDPSTASITTNDMLDREFMDVHYLRVVAALEDHPQLSATTTLQVRGTERATDRFSCM
jgi:cadherin EGF LAG seven-pass G-type receptor 1